MSEKNIEVNNNMNMNGEDIVIQLPDNVTKENIMAVTAGAAQKAVPENLEIKVTNVPDFAAMVAKDETAVENNSGSDSLAKLDELGFFSPVRGMANIRNVLDDKLYAKNHIDENHNRYIEYRQRYNDGTYSPLGKLAQASLKLAAQYKFCSQDATESKIKNSVGKFILDTAMDYNGRIAGDSPEDILDFKTLLSVLYTAMPHLPVDSDIPAELDARTFYGQLEQHLKGLQTILSIDFKSYYILFDDGIAELARAMNMKRNELLKTLKKFGFLYLTNSSAGYQTNVRFNQEGKDSFTQWAYCIYKLEYLANIEKKAEKQEKDDF